MPAKKADQVNSFALTGLRSGQARCAAPVVIDQPEGKPAKWRLNSGAVMLTWIGGLGYCALVIDLATARFEAAEIPMLREHSQWAGPIGRWTAGSIDATGIYGSPIVYTPETDAEKDMPSLREGAEVAALIKRKHPWQASVTATSALSDYERVLPGQSVVVNGQPVTASDDIDAPPLYVAHNSIISEASVCLFGADADTGAVAASRSTTTPEPTMSKPEDRIVALLKRFPGDKNASRIAVSLSKGMTDEQITVELSDAKDADHAAAIAAKDAEIAKLKEGDTAKDAKITELQAKLDALKTDSVDSEKIPDATGGESKNAAPKTYQQGVAILKREGSKLDGFKLRTAVLKRFPSLRHEGAGGIPNAVPVKA